MKKETPLSIKSQRISQPVHPPYRERTAQSMKVVTRAFNEVFLGPISHILEKPTIPHSKHGTCQELSPPSCDQQGGSIESWYLLDFNV